MRYQSVLATMLGLSSLGLAGCSDDAAGPSPTSAASPPVPASAVAANSWLTRTDMLTTRTGLAIATVPNAAGQSIVYTIGGANPSRNPLQSLTIYNVATNTWSFGRKLPVPLAWTNGAEAINGKIYVSGGFRDRDQNWLSQGLYMYDPATSTWTQKRDLPSVKGPYYDPYYVGAQGVTGVINGKLYVVTACYWVDEYTSGPELHESNCYGGAVSPKFFRYNPVTDQWVALPPPFGSFVHSPFAGGVIGGKFYVMGGAAQDPGRLVTYDPATNRWTTKTPMGQARPGAATAVLGGKLYVFGGTRFNAKLGYAETLDKTLSYDPATNLWTTRASMPSARTGIAATPVTVSGQARIEVIGGPAPGNNLQYAP